MASRWKPGLRWSCSRFALPAVRSAVSADGRLVCFAFRKEGRLKLYLMDADGTEVRVLAPSLDIRGTPSWSPDGKWIAVAAIQQDGSRLFKVPIDGGQPVRITQGVADSPVWSPDGNLILYAEPVASSTYTIRAVTPEGTPRPLPDLVALRGGDRYRFWQTVKRWSYCWAIFGDRISGYSTSRPINCDE